MNDLTGLFAIEGFASLFTAFVIIFLLREIVAFKKALGMKYLFTPLITLSIIMLLLLSVKSSGMSTFQLFVLSGLFFSLVGDTFLMLEEADYFIHGLTFFMFAQVSYIIAFSQNYIFSAWNIGLILVLLIIVIILHVKVRKFSVLIYSMLLSTMFFFAVSSFNHGFSTGAMLLAFGSAVFCLSDIVLSINAFLKRIPHSTVITWALYGPAQLCFALSCFFY